MKDQLEILKGVHPGLFLSRELRNRQLRSGAFAESIGVHPQTLSAIIKGRRNMNIPLSLKIERSLHLDEGLLMTLQVYYDIELERRKKLNHIILIFLYIVRSCFGIQTLIN